MNDMDKEPKTYTMHTDHIEVCLASWEQECKDRAPDPEDAFATAVFVLRQVKNERDLLRGAMKADDERLKIAGDRVGMGQWGCEIPEMMADKIEELTKERDTAVLLASDLQRESDNNLKVSFELSKQFDMLVDETSKLKQAAEDMHNELSSLVDLLTLERDEARECMVEFVQLNCSTDDETGLLDSMGNSTNADAMRLLARSGKLTITTDVGRRVIGKWA